MRESENPVESLRDTINFSARDWSIEKRDAWIYGVVVGWGSSLSEVAKRFEWKPETVARLKRLCARFNRSEDYQRIIQCPTCTTRVRVSNNGVLDYPHDTPQGPRCVQHVVTSHASLDQQLYV